MQDKLRQIKLKSIEYSGYTAENLSGIVRVPSLSGDEELVINKLKGQLVDAGVRDFWLDSLGNLVATVGNGPKKLVFDAHIDCVDTGNIDAWDKNPYSGDIEGGYVYGRGTVDQKGGAASMITAARILTEMKYDGEFTVYFVFSIMEEDCDGMCWRSLIENDKLRPDFAVITEPTNCSVYRGHRGRMEIEVHFKGTSSHGSMPERGDNAIYKASKAALEIEKLNEKLKFDEFLGKGTCTLSMIQSKSPSLCAVSDYCMFHIDRRLTWGETKESAIAEVRNAVGSDADVIIPLYEKESYRGTTFVQEKYYPTWKLEENHPLVQSGIETYTSLFDEKPVVDKWTFSTNGVAIAGVHKIPSIGFGPGNEIYAHSPNEKTPIADLEKASAFYALLPYILEKNFNQ